MEQQEQPRLRLQLRKQLKQVACLFKFPRRIFRKFFGGFERPLVIFAKGGLFKSNHQYLTSYKGLAFFTKSGTEIILPVGTETIAANKIWIP